MSPNTEFLRTTYGGYYHRDVPDEDAVLTHVGHGTPAGEYLRRFWHPIAISDDLTDLPLAIQILGEELVVFRDKNGDVGCLELHCSHRGTSLEFGLIEERGIRCCYHGWLFGVDGTILDTPGEPVDSTYKERLCHGAYPVMEQNGLIFAYMGPPDRVPPLLKIDSFEVPGTYYAVAAKVFIPCNWLQLNDNSPDLFHLRYLHTLATGAQFGASLGLPSESNWIETDFGITAFDTRRVRDKIWVRLDDIILPNMVQGAPVFEEGKEEKRLMLPDFFAWHVPVNDTNSLGFFLIRWPEGEEITEDRKVAVRQQVEQRTCYEDIQRVPYDVDVFTSQRPIAIHALEHLAETDRGVITLRRQIRDGIQAVQQDLDPQGIFRDRQGAVDTFACGTTVVIPSAGSTGEDREILRQTSQEWLEHCLKNPPSRAARSQHIGAYEPTGPHAVSSQVTGPDTPA